MGKGDSITGPEYVYFRTKLTLVEVDDVNQVVRPSVDVFMYWEPTWRVEGVVRGGTVRFQNMHKPIWVPHLDFNNEVQESLTTDESYWYDEEDNLIFMRWTVIPTVQDRFDHAAFPFDRQILDVQLLSNNCQMKPWELTEYGTFPVECSMQNQDWIIQCELAAVADSWDLERVELDVVNDNVAWSVSARFRIFVQRSSGYFLWNIGFVYALIIAAQVCLIVYPYNESRFDFAMALALTSVAFLFVSSSMVPKTSYLTRLDQFFLLGLVLLACRFILDTIMQLTLTIPVGDEGYRGTCEDIDDKVTICVMDAVVTSILSGTWILCSIAFLNFGGYIFRPSWDSMNRFVSKEGSSKSRIEFEIKGRGDIEFKTRAMTYSDVQDSAIHVPLDNTSFNKSHN